MTDAWVADPKPVPPELEPTFEHAVYPPDRVHFDPIADKIDHATLAQLREMARGGIGEPDAGPKRSTAHPDEGAQPG
jgi:hypothetical protein